jgi:hypothetical protein
MNLPVPVDLLRSVLRAMANVEVHLCEGELPPALLCTALDYTIMNLSGFMADKGVAPEPLASIDAWREWRLQNMGA